MLLLLTIHRAWAQHEVLKPIDSLRQVLQLKQDTAKYNTNSKMAHEVIAAQT